MGRGKGQGSIFQRKEGGAYYLTYVINGKAKRVSLGVTFLKDKKDSKGDIIQGAESLAREHLAASNKIKTKQDVINFAAEARGIINKSLLDFNDVWIEFVKAYKRPASVGTMSNYEKHWNRFRAWLSGRYPQVSELRQIGESMAHEYCDYLEKVDKLAASTYNQHRGTLLLIFETLRHDAGIINNPWKNTTRKNVKADTISRKKLSDADIKALFEFIESESFTLHPRHEWKVLFHLGAYTGMRLADCCLLTRNAVDWENCIIHAAPVKTRRIGRTVTIPIFEPLKIILEPFINSLKSSDFLVPSIAAEYKHYQDGIKRKVESVFSAAGFETKISVTGRKNMQSVIGFHSLRGSLATKLLIAGVPTAVVSEIIGDDIKTIESHYFEAMVKDIHAATRNIKF